jgi:C4-dicarboxylate-specific signal transduction histidine kinase
VNTNSLAKVDLSNKSNQEIEKLINFLPTIAIWIDEDLTIKRANDLFSIIINKNQTEITSSKLTDYPFKNLLQYFAHIEVLRNRDQDLSIVDNFEINSVQKSVRFFIKEIVEEKSFLIVGIDISKELFRQKFFEETRQQQEESARLILIGQISAGVAHGINNPLAIISAFLFKMKRNIESPDGEINRDDFLKNISKSKISIDRIAMIVRGLKFLEKNAQNSPFENTPVQDIINSVLDIFSDKFKVSGIQLNVANTTPEMIISCRPSQITQVILNLLMNSHDAIENCEIKWVEIKFYIDNKNITISVTDSGLGISPEIQDKIMQPFFTTKSAEKGVGLGLSTSKLILQDHRGDLILDKNSPNTKFDIIFKR